MGYFPNGTDAEIYKEAYCYQCVNWKDDGNGFGCAIMDIHFVSNYDECNNKNSILHILIPRDKDGSNKECRMFSKEKNSDWEDFCKWADKNPLAPDLDDLIFRAKLQGN